jgi:hypothetical protein
MSNTANTAESAPQFADYCGIPVIVLNVESTEYGTLAAIQYEDGREEEVPLVRLNLL